MMYFYFILLKDIETLFFFIFLLKKRTRKHELEKKIQNFWKQLESALYFITFYYILLFF